MKLNLKILLSLLLASALAFSCKEKSKPRGDTRMIAEKETTSLVFYDSLYYYLYNENMHFYLQAAEDITKIQESEVYDLCAMNEEYGLRNMWHPQLIRMNGIWYIYTAADDGNTDNHKIYVLEYDGPDPRKVKFTLHNRIITDKEDNWGIHPFVFEHAGNMYMVWSGWESRRIFSENQCLYIAQMKDPYSLATDRVMISRPEFEWELQWIDREGSGTRYPIFVNEAPFFFHEEGGDKVYIYYSASGNWTPFYCVGQLSADTNANLLDPASWKKEETPVFSENRETGILGPGHPRIIPTADGYAFIYSAFMAGSNVHPRSVFLRPIEVVDGRPVL